jgi:hypothetical protein
MSDTYNLFYKKRKLELKESFPNKNGQDIQKMIRDEWKKQNGNGACIKARVTTIQYEVIKTFIEKTPRFNISDFPNIVKIVNDKSCIYCGSDIVKKRAGDHLIPVVSNASMPLLSNFSYLTVPCCAKCNSKKGKKHWREFVANNENCNKNIDKLNTLQEFIDTHIVYYEIDIEKYKDIVKTIQSSLETIRVMSQDISINEKIKPEIAE